MSADSDQTTQAEAARADNLAINAFARAMSNKMRWSREKGRKGWQTRSNEWLREILRAHVQKGDPVDVANYCMTIHQNVEAGRG